MTLRPYRSSDIHMARKDSLNKRGVSFQYAESYLCSENRGSRKMRNHTEVQTRSSQFDQQDGGKIQIAEA